MFPFFSHQGLHLTAMTFQTSWRVAWQRYQPIPSGLWDAYRQVPLTYVCWGSSGGHKPGLPLQWEGLYPSGPHLAVHQLGRGEKKVCQWRLRQKKLSTSAFSSSADTRLPFLFIGKGYSFFNLPSLVDVPVEVLLVILGIPGQAPAMPWPSWPHPYTTGQHPYTLPKTPVPASTACANKPHLSNLCEASSGYPATAAITTATKTQIYATLMISYTLQSSIIASCSLQ